MFNLINNQWRITKYNPDFRDVTGSYTLTEEWTCPSEIGKIIDGNEFTLAEYLRVEGAYVNSVIEFLNDSGLYKLRILLLSKFDVSPEDKLSLLYEAEFDDLEIQEDKAVSATEIRTICKMILRNFIWCSLYSKDNFFVNFGYDYYMYIGSNEKCYSAIKFANNNGLFVERFRSPYYFTEEETIRMIQWNEIDDEDKVIIGDEELNGISLDEYCKIFNLSKEHPVIGSFEITEEHSIFFQKFLKHKMDFTKFEYGFCGEY